MKSTYAGVVRGRNQHARMRGTNCRDAPLKQKKFKEALRDCENALFINNKFAKAHLRATTCYLQLGELQKAQSAIEQAIALGEETADRIS